MQPCRPFERAVSVLQKPLGDIVCLSARSDYAAGYDARTLRADLESLIGCAGAEMAPSNDSAARETRQRVSVS